MSLNTDSQTHSSPRAADSNDYPSERPRNSDMVLDKDPLSPTEGVSLQTVPYTANPLIYPPSPSSIRRADSEPRLKVNCLVYGDDVKCTFNVQLEASYTVANLKDAIKEKKKHAFRHVDANTLDLWKVSTPIGDNSDGIPDGKPLLPVEQLSTVFPEPPVLEHIHIIVKGPAIESKFDDAPEDGRVWTVTGAIRSIDIDRCYYVDPGIQDESKHCLNALLRYQFVLLAGARASGKTTRLFWLRRELETKNYHVIYLSFERVECDNVQSFWNTFGLAVQAAAAAGPFAVSQNFTPQISYLFSDSIIQEQCLRAFREIRNNPEPYAIRGVIAAGTSGILCLTPTFTTSPFNVVDHVRNPYFSINETRKLFLEFAKDKFITIDDAVIEDVWVKSNGHPGMGLWVCHMIASLLREETTPAVNLLRSRFVGFLDTVFIEGGEEEQQANFLTAEGVLLQPAPNIYQVASAYVDGLIRRYLIPEKFPIAPSTPPPIASDGRLCVLEVLTQSLRFFDQDLIRLAATRSYKQSKVDVGSFRGVRVPRESVYDTELMRILKNWLKQDAYEINGQWHLQTDQDKHKYCNIVISKPTTPTVVLEVLATGDVSFVQAHIEKTPYYKDLLSADEAWVVHFTCEDDYLDHPTWQSDEQLQRGGINVVHFWHDQGFSTVSMSARWKDADGNIQKIDNQEVVLLV